MKQTKLTKEARGRDCQVRIPGCPNDTETTVFAHYRLAGTCGTSMKPNDLQGAWACSYCQDRIDQRAKCELTRFDLRLYHLEGMVRTIDTLTREGKL